MKWGLSWFSCFSNGFLSISGFLGFLTLFFFVSLCVFFVCVYVFCVFLALCMRVCLSLSLSLCMYNFISPSLCISVYVCVHVSFLGVFLVDCDLRTFCL